ncbi:MAG: hypothetical protein WC520_00100 [Candidatus Paceibacterota bacterium]
MNKKTSFLIVLILVIAVAGAFYGGMKYGQAKRGSFGGMDFQNMTAEQRQQMQQNGLSKNRQTANMIMGEIINKDDKSITVKLPDNGSKIIFFSDATKVTKNADGTFDDLIVGENVTISGSANQDGSVTANSIQLKSFAPLESDMGADQPAK